ncbi:hypothetical protein ACJRO7_001978 [Eucalyptus globulus]|uniref:Uncharacterized protein n=1 Tax=Eucalyptus globulus TaxID=34317 RepID=A0ABD3LW22_EUCGL
MGRGGAGDKIMGTHVGQKTEKVKGDATSEDKAESTTHHGALRRMGSMRDPPSRAPSSNAISGDKKGQSLSRVVLFDADSSPLLLRTLVPAERLVGLDRNRERSRSRA